MRGVDAVAAAARGQASRQGLRQRRSRARGVPAQHAHRRVELADQVDRVARRRAVGRRAHDQVPRSGTGGQGRGDPVRGEPSVRGDSVAPDLVGAQVDHEQVRPSRRERREVRVRAVLARGVGPGAGVRQDLDRAARRDGLARERAVGVQRQDAQGPGRVVRDVQRAGVASEQQVARVRPAGRHHRERAELAIGTGGERGHRARGLLADRVEHATARMGHDERRRGTGGGQSRARQRTRGRVEPDAPHSFAEPGGGTGAGLRVRTDPQGAR